MIQAGYTGVKGTNLDILRAPNRGPGGALIPGTQAFIWESSGGRSLMNAAQPADPAPAGPRVQWGHLVHARQVDGRRLVARRRRARGRAERQESGRRMGAVEFRPPSPAVRRVLRRAPVGTQPPVADQRGAARGTRRRMVGPAQSDAAIGNAADGPRFGRGQRSSSRGVNGSLRANYDGGPIQLADPTVDEFFDVGVVLDSSSGTVRRLFAERDHRVPARGNSTRCSSATSAWAATAPSRFQLNAINLLNTVQWAAVDTNVNSPTFGQVALGQADADDDGDREAQVLKMSRSIAAGLATFCFVRGASLSGQQSAPVRSAGTPVFRSGVNLVLVDAVVRDRSGSCRQGSDGDDFELLEDGVRQQIVDVCVRRDSAERHANRSSVDAWLREGRLRGPCRRPFASAGAPSGRRDAVARR